LSNEQLRARVDRLADQGFRGITISYDVWPDQVDTIVAEANRRGLATIGELEFTSYPYAVRALCTIDPTSSVVKGYGDELAQSHTALMPTLSMEATADRLDIPATMPMCSAGAMSDASNPAVSQTFYSSTPIRERMSQRSTKSIRSGLKVQLWTPTQWAERISRDSNHGLQMKVSYCLSRRACANPPEDGAPHRSAGSWSGLGGHLVAVRTQIPHIFEVNT
jgi:hypothetical protein